MIHIGRDTKSTIIAKGISAEKRQHLSRISISPTASDARNFTQCDSLLIGHECGAHTFPISKAKTVAASLNTRRKHIESQRRAAIRLPTKGHRRRESCQHYSQRFL